MASTIAPRSKSHAASSPRVAEWERLMKSLQEPSRRRARGRMVGRHGAGLSSESGWISGGAGHCPRRRSVAHVLKPAR